MGESADTSKIGRVPEIPSNHSRRRSMSCADGELLAAESHTSTLGKVNTSAVVIDCSAGSTSVCCRLCATGMLASVPDITDDRST